jgi:hypothetical protein
MTSCPWFRWDSRVFIYSISGKNTIPAGYRRLPSRHYFGLALRQTMSESGGSARASTRFQGALNREQYDKVKTKYKVFDKRAETEYARVEALHATKPFTATGNPYEYAVLYHLTQLKGEDRRRIKCIYSLHFFAFRRTGALISRSLSCVMFFPAAQDQPSPKGSPKPGKHGKGIYTISYMHFSNLLRLLLFLEMCV